MGGTQSTESLPRYPVFDRVPKRDNTVLIIIIIIIIILAIAVAIVVYAVRRPVSTTTTGRCEPGLCVVNLGTGLKTCPTSDSEQLLYDIVFEVCTSRSYCQDSKAPCAVLAGGILNCDGLCGIGNPQCRCIPRP